MSPTAALTLLGEYVRAPDEEPTVTTCTVVLCAVTYVSLISIFYILMIYHHYRANKPRALLTNAKMARVENCILNFFFFRTNELSKMNRGD
jgi:hypothetical protein